MAIKVVMILSAEESWSCLDKFQSTAPCTAYLGGKIALCALIEKLLQQVPQDWAEAGLGIVLGSEQGHS